MVTALAGWYAAAAGRTIATTDTANPFGKRHWVPKTVLPFGSGRVRTGWAGPAAGTTHPFGMLIGFPRRLAGVQDRGKRAPFFARRDGAEGAAAPGLLALVLGGQFGGGVGVPVEVVAHAGMSLTGDQAAVAERRHPGDQDRQAH